MGSCLDAIGRGKTGTLAGWGPRHQGETDLAETRGGEAHGGRRPGLTRDGPSRSHASLRHRSSVWAVGLCFVALPRGRFTLTFPGFGAEGKMCPLALLAHRSSRCPLPASPAGPGLETPWHSVSASPWHVTLHPSFPSWRLFTFPQCLESSILRGSRVCTLT